MKLTKIKLNVLCAAGLFVVALRARSDEIRFFDSHVDYWPKEEPAPTPSTKEEAKTQEIVERHEEKKSFDWQKVMDPKNDDFFREGDYLPPAPFMEVARNPSDQNIRLWHAYIQKKNDLTARLQRRLVEYGSSQKPAAMPSVSPQLAMSTPAVDNQMAVPNDTKRYQLRLYFDSECPHCKRMMQTMEDLSKRGFSVEAKQIDSLPFDTKGFSFPFSKASREDVAKQNISSVPFLLAADLKNQVTYRLVGFKTPSEIFSDIGNYAKK
jgi:thiol-disulfide isomerase/thioredoxin